VDESESNTSVLRLSVSLDKLLDLVLEQIASLRENYSVGSLVTKKTLTVLFKMVKFITNHLKAGSEEEGAVAIKVIT